MHILSGWKQKAVKAAGTEAEGKLDAEHLAHPGKLQECDKSQRSPCMNNHFTRAYLEELRLPTFFFSYFLQNNTHIKLRQAGL